MENTNHFLDRYQNHIQTAGIGVPGQEAISKSKILVIGGGDLASPVLSYLASMGTGTLGIVISGTIAKKDLPGQPILFSNHEGKLKGQIIAGQLREINPEGKIKLHEQNFDAQNIHDIISDYDVVVDISQNTELSLLINDACVILRKPTVFGKLISPSGYLSVFNYKGGATLRCALQQSQATSILQENAKSGFAALGGIIGSFVANESVKIVTQLGDPITNKLVRINTYSNQMESIKVEPVQENLSISTLQENPTQPSLLRAQGLMIRSISPKLLAIKIKYKETLQLIDICETNQPEEQNSWNYLHLSAEQLFNDLDQIHKDIAVILISEDGAGAKKLATALNGKNRFDNIYYLEGGIKAWIEETGTPSIVYESF